MIRGIGSLKSCRTKSSLLALLLGDLEDLRVGLGHCSGTLLERGGLFPLLIVVALSLLNRGGLLRSRGGFGWGILFENPRVLQRVINSNPTKARTKKNTKIKL
jgi:hypothetical protein